MAENRQKLPLFVLGSGRSGTTLLQRTLNSHPEVCIWGEHSGFLKQIAQAYFTFYDDKNFVENVLMHNQKGLGAKGNFINVKNPANWQAWVNWISQEDIKANFRGFLESFFNPSETNVLFWGFKEIRYGIDDRVLEFLKEIYPEARFIFIVRNPRDTILSQLAMFYSRKKENFVVCAKNWAMQNEKYLEFSKNNPDKALIIKYEDFIEDNENVVNKVFSFLGIPCYGQQKEIIYFDGGRGEDPFPLLRKDILNASELAMIKNLTCKVSREFGYTAK